MKSWIYWLVGALILVLVIRGIYVMLTSLRRTSERRNRIDAKVVQVANLLPGQKDVVYDVRTEEEYDELRLQLKGYGAQCHPYDPVRGAFTVDKIRGRI